MVACKICQNTVGNQSYLVREMMFGYRDEFEYFMCGQCGCLQISTIPTDLTRYYPPEYYSFQNHASKGFFKNFLKRPLAYYFLRKTKWFRHSPIKRQTKILDVGCGAGHLLLSLRSIGFSNLIGVDPFIEKNIFYENGVQIFKKSLSALTGQFDFIMLHHSFEHLPEPLVVCRKLKRLLAPNGQILIRIPLVSSLAWKKYGVNWVQLDAPRHLFLHTLKSLEILAHQADLHVTKIIFDSTAFQFWGSEQYLKNIALRDKISYAQNPQQSIFSKKQIRSFTVQAATLNKNQTGDSACFYFS